MKKIYSYLLAASAMLTMVLATGCKDPMPEPTPGPDGPKVPEISLSEVTELATVRSAVITVTVKNADKFKYTYYTRDARPTDIKWSEVAVDKDGVYKVTIIDLPVNPKADTYDFEAFACLKDEVSPTKTAGFRPLAALPVMVGDVQPSPRSISFIGEIVPEYCEAFCYQVRLKSEYDEKAFLEDVAGSYNIIKETGVCVEATEAGMTYQLAVQPIMINEKGEFESLVGDVLKSEIKTQEYSLGQRNVAVTMAFDPATATFSGVMAEVSRPGPEVKGFYAGSVTKAELGSKSIETYINQSDWLLDNANMSFVSFDAEAPDKDYKFNLKAQTEYVVFAIASDKNGFVGSVVSAPVVTPAVAFTDPATVVADYTLYKDMVEVAFDFKNNCQKVFYAFAPTSDALTQEQAVEKMLENVSFDLENFVKGGDENWPFTLYGVTPDTHYDIYLLPMSDKGALGAVIKEEFTTLSDEVLFDSPATLTFAIGDTTGVIAPGGGYTYFWNFPCTPTLANGAVSWEYGVAAPEDFEQGFVFDDAKVVAKMLYKTGGIRPASTKEDGSVVDVEPIQISNFGAEINTIDRYIVFIPLDADGAYGTPVMKKVNAKGRPKIEEPGGDKPKSRR